MADLDILTYEEKKAFSKGRQEGRDAERRRMHGLGMDTETISQALGVSPEAVAGLLQEPAVLDETESCGTSYQGRWRFCAAWPELGPYDAGCQDWDHDPWPVLLSS